MATEKQIAANRANSEKSTGPKTEAGKSKSRANSRKHGLTAEMLIIVDEHAHAFDALRAELFEEYDPQTAFECELVERLAGIVWRLRRVPFFEAAIIDARHSQADRLKLGGGFFASAQIEGEEEEESDWQKSVHFGCALINDACTSDAVGKLDRHETKLMNNLTKTLQMLLKLQENRASKRETVRLEAVVLSTAA